MAEKNPVSGPIPRLAVILGDPAGIGPELIARLLADEAARNRAEIVIIADKAETERGMDIAGMRFPYKEIDTLDSLPFVAGTPLLYNFRGGVTSEFERAKVTAAGGRYSLGTMEQAVRLTQAGRTDGILFGPFNKASLHMGGMTQNDELHWLADLMGHEGPICEFNTMDGLWTTRVTSHVSIAEVPSLVTIPRVVDGIRLIYGALLQFGVERPRVAVCGLNPHNGDAGNFGREEIDVIAPAIELAAAAGMPASGPFPADTIFLKVFGEKREYDGVVTMYHDQGQIAIKLMGFSRGVTVQGGLPIPIATPAHGTAFDISQKGQANVGATLQAFNVVARMAATARAKRETR